MTRTSRERRVWKIVRKALLYSLFVLSIGVVVWLLRTHAQGSVYDSLSGFLIGWGTVLPFGVALLLFRAYRQMDEYGQRLQERACALAFVATLLAGLAVMSTGTEARIPLWVVCMLGLLAYAATILQGTLAARRERE